MAVALALTAIPQGAAARDVAMADSVAMPAVADSMARLASPADSALAHADSIAERISRAEATTDSIARSIGRALVATDSTIAADKAALIAGKPAAIDGKPAREKRDWNTWRPKPQRALWLALVIPGGGQIYNRKYWKLPIIYGGFMGCLYAMNWNNMMYKDYSQAYLDIMDSDPTTESYNKFLHLGASGVQMGTRFVATHECDADQRFKESYLAATDADVTIIKSPVGMPGRALNNAFIEAAREGRKKPSPQ